MELKFQIRRFISSFKEDSFIPHGSKSDGNSSLQPIFLSDKLENVNEAKFIVYAYPLSTIPDGSIYERCFVVFKCF